MERHVMTAPDLNLLITLDVLLREGSVARAARCLRLSPSAMSRALARLRETTGDPLLVRAGRGCADGAAGARIARAGRSSGAGRRGGFAPRRDTDPGRLQRTFTLRNTDGFVETFAAALLARIGEEAPGYACALQKADKDSTPLREGRWTWRRCGRRHHGSGRCTAASCFRITGSGWCVRGIR